jgi:hypothetical protein
MPRPRVKFLLKLTILIYSSGRKKPIKANRSASIRRIKNNINTEHRIGTSTGAPGYTRKKRWALMINHLLEKVKVAKILRLRFY